MSSLFDVRLSNKAEKFIRKEADEKLKARLKELFEILRFEPVPAKHYDVRKIEGQESSYRIRLSSFRVSYKVFWEEKIIRVAQIERRDEHTYRA